MVGFLFREVPGLIFREGAMSRRAAACEGDAVLFDEEVSKFVGHREPGPRPFTMFETIQIAVDVELARAVFQQPVIGVFIVAEAEGDSLSLSNHCRFNTRGREVQL